MQSGIWYGAALTTNPVACGRPLRVVLLGSWDRRVWESGGMSDLQNKMKAGRPCVRVLMVGSLYCFTLDELLRNQ